MSDAPTVPGLIHQAKTLAGYVQAVLGVGSPSMLRARRGCVYESTVSVFIGAGFQFL